MGGFSCNFLAYAPTSTKRPTHALYQDVVTQTSKHNNSADSHIDKNNEGAGASNEEPDVTVRKYGEVFLSTLSSVAALVEYPKGMRCG